MSDKNQGESARPQRSELYDAMNLGAMSHFVKCCDAGAITFPEPCPWHGTNDPMHQRIDRVIGSATRSI